MSTSVKLNPSKRSGKPGRPFTVRHFNPNLSPRADSNAMSLNQRKRASKVLQEVAVEHGGLEKIAKRFKITRQAVQKWYATGVVPSTRVVDLVRFLKKEGVTEKTFRPDVFKG